jgi:hypothetical protein
MTTGDNMTNTERQEFAAALIALRAPETSIEAQHLISKEIVLNPHDGSEVVITHTQSVPHLRMVIVEWANEFGHEDVALVPASFKFELA